jgi:hypothetical protein
VSRTPETELLVERERLTERFALMQSELGGLFYEMAIRDHVQMDVLIDRAAALQQLDRELARVERAIREAAAGPRPVAPGEPADALESQR